MKKTEINKILYITIGLTIAYMFSLQYVGINSFSIEGFRKISSFFSCVVILWGLYFYYGWKIPVLNKLIYKTNLNGSWFGTYSSKGTDGKEYKGEIALVIRQTFLNINVTSHTDKYLSYSFAETLLHNKESESNQLVYLYSQNEFDPTDERLRKGSSELHLLCELNGKTLFGEFWTNYNTKGKLNVKHVSSYHYNSFNDIKSALGETLK